MRTARTLVREPDAGNRPVRFDERGVKTEHGRRILRHNRGNPETEVSRSQNHRVTPRLYTGNQVPELNNKRGRAINGRRFSGCCHSPPLAFTPTTIDAEPTQESLWLKRRLEEATDAWDPLVPDWILVILREALDGTVLDEELLAALKKVPSWLPDRQ